MNPNFSVTDTKPYLVYSSYDPIGCEMRDLFVDKYGYENIVDVFEYPDVVSDPWLATVVRSPSLVFRNKVKPNSSNHYRWTVFDIPSQIRRALLR